MKKNTALFALILSFVVLGICVLLLLPEKESGQSATQPSVDANGSQLIINEICAKNNTILADAEGRHRDYIEFYNPGPAISLSGLSLSDGKSVSTPFGEVILPQDGYLVVFLADELTGFALGASGADKVQLLDSHGNILLQVVTEAMEADQVMQYVDGAYSLTYDASPGFPNDAAGVSMFRYGIEETNPKIIISEVLMDNVTALPDENLCYSDIVELRNISEETVDLSNYYLSDDLTDRMCYRLPAVSLAPGEFVLVWCDRGDYVSADGYIHANFGLSQGETLVLTDLENRRVKLEVSVCGKDQSLSLQKDGTYQVSMASLGFSNDESGIAAFQASRSYADAPLVISEILLSSSDISYQGKFCDLVEIFNRSAETVNTAGWYLTDGNDPFQYALPARDLAPGEYMVILCDKTAIGFALSEKDVLRLTSPEHLSCMPVSCSAGSISWVAWNGQESYVAMDATPGYANTAQGHEQYLRQEFGRGLMISEVMTSNQSYLPGAYATTCDWIELYNASDTEILLSNYFITEDTDYLWKYSLPNKTLRPGERVVIFLSEEGKNLLSGYSVLPFNLSASGETLCLSDINGVVDLVHVPALQVDTTYGRPDESIFFAVLAEVTPDMANGEAANITEMPVAVTPQGVYNDVEYLDVVLSGEGQIYYTTDCTVPDLTSRPYTGPIRITETTVFRVICVGEGKQPSAVLDLTYLINEGDTLEVVTLVADPDALFSWENGIYVMGPNASDKAPYYGANFWQDIEVPATISLFEKDGGGFSSGCGIKIFGGYSRYEDKKSLACFFRAEYGASELDYQLFGEAGLDTYEAFVLRSGGQDVFWARMRDVMITSLVSEQTTVPVQKYRPVVVYINGQYFGLHYIREKLNENYVAGNFNVEKEDVVLCETEGWNSVAYRSLIQYAMNHDMNDPVHYEYVCSRIDVDNYIDYMVAQIWIGNLDNSNVRFFKTTDGKWTWILYDTDQSFYTVSYNSVKIHLDKNAIGNDDVTSKTLAVCLLNNPEFKDMFLQRMAWQIANIWTEENVNTRIDHIKALIETDMNKDCQRWSKSYSYWEQSVQDLRTFAAQRNDYLIPYIQAFFGLTQEQMVQYGFPV